MTASQGARVLLLLLALPLVGGGCGGENIVLGGTPTPTRTPTATPSPTVTPPVLTTDAALR